MSAVNCPSSEDRAIEILPSQPDPPGEQSVLPPFSGKLRIDEQLKWRHENFKQTIDDFFSDKNITPLSQLSSTPAFPTPHVLAQFASKVYTDYKTGETDAQYETRLDLPNGWKLLTTASNGRRNNGYFGAAYWYPEHQQVVIAHRGTKLTKLEAMWTDIVEVIRKHHVPQMGSASTFAHKVVEDLRKVNQEKRTNFQVFFTGRFLGGWLAQITTFTTKCLKIEENTFLKSYNVSHSYHPHTVVFDSPGCKDMLSQMTDKLDVRLDGRAIDLEQLDITSYLSAPNRINTCNRHLGTVFRIFTGLSDMGWLETSNALYNSATQSRDIYVEFFDPENGQMYRDEQGKLKIQEVVDWPVTAGLSRDKQFKSFFNQVKNVNDYHPDIKEYTFQIKGYQPMRYQTKTYDDRVSRLSVFCQQEPQFLESYFSLRQLPELFKPKDLFSVIEEKQSQKQAEKLLLGFEIENYTIRCTNANELQELIPYVKRLLALYPQLGENTKGVLTQQQIGNNVYQFVTKRYVEILRQNPLEISKPDDLNLRDFLNSEEHKVLQLRMVDGDAWTGLIKVYKMLEKAPTMKDLLNEGHYTILTLEHLVHVNQLVNLNTLLQSSTAPHLLMMSSETSHLLNVETKQILKSLFNTLCQKQSVKIILITQSENNTVTLLQGLAKEIFCNGFVTRDELLTWNELTTSSQEKLLEKSVKFQGARISLAELMSAESPVANSLPLDVLLEEKELKIAYPVPIANAYNEVYYIGRTLRHLKTIRQDIFNDKDVRDSHVYLASTEQEFKQLCQQNPKSNVHWLEEDKSGKFLWQQSQGSSEKLREYIHTDSSHTYTADDLDKLLEQAVHQRVMLISDTAGMGKSTLLTHLSKQIKQNFPAKWVVRIDLNDHTDALKTLIQRQIDKKKAADFVSTKLLKLKPSLEIELFKQCCEQKQKLRIVIMMDGFDEISPSYKKIVTDLLQALRQTAVEQLWVTTRPHLRNELEDKLQQLSYTLEPFSEEDQFEFLTKFWSLKDWFAEVDNEERQEVKNKLETCATQLIKNVAKSISDKDIKFTGIPLQCRMLAEAFDEEIKTFCLASESMAKLPLKLDLLDLYEKFLNRKYDIYLEEKLKISNTNTGAMEARNIIVQNIRENHQIVALNLFFAEEQVNMLRINSRGTFSPEELSRIGIAQVNCEGKLHFIHSTLAEYYVAECLVNNLTERNNTSLQVQTFLLKDIIREEEYKVIRVFIDGLISRSELSQEVLKQYGNGIRDLGKDGELILHQAAGEANANIIGFLLDSLQAADYRDTVRRLLLVQDKKRRTVWHMAAMGGNLQLLQKLLECANENLKIEDINNKLISTTDYMGSTVWHVATKVGNLDVLEKLWEWAKEKRKTKEMNDELLLATDNTGNTVLHIAAMVGNLKLLNQLWEWVEENLATEEISNKLLLTTDNKRRTIWHVETMGGNLDILEKIWEWAEKKLKTEEIINKFLLATDAMGNTVWHIAAKGGSPDLLEKLWEWAKEKPTTEKVRKKVLLAADNLGNTVWHAAAKAGKLQFLQKLWELNKEKLTTEEISNIMLLATDNLGCTVWHVAAKEGNLELLQKIWEWAKKNLTTEEINNRMLFAADYRRSTVWHMAAKGGKLDVLQQIWEWGKGTLTTEEVKNNLLLATTSFRRTVWHVAADGGNLKILENLMEWAKGKLTTDEVKEQLVGGKYTENSVWLIATKRGNLGLLEKIWEWAKENLTSEEINNNLLLAANTREMPAWHIAANAGNLELLEKLWEWAEEKLTTDEINNQLLLSTGEMGCTAWHLAVQKGNLEIFEKIWEWAEEKLTTEEINNKLLLATDKLGNTAWHIAAKMGNSELLEKIWEWPEEKLTTEEINNKLLLATDKLGNTAWRLAAHEGIIEILQKICDLAKVKLTTEEINNKLFLATDKWGSNAWHEAQKVAT